MAASDPRFLGHGRRVSVCDSRDAAIPSPVSLLPAHQDSCWRSPSLAIIETSGKFIQRPRRCRTDARSCVRSSARPEIACDIHSLNNSRVLKKLGCDAAFDVEDKAVHESSKTTLRWLDAWSAAGMWPEALQSAATRRDAMAGYVRPLHQKPAHKDQRPDVAARPSLILFRILVGPE